MEISTYGSPSYFVKKFVEKHGFYTVALFLDLDTALAEYRTWIDAHGEDSALLYQAFECSVSQ